MLLLLILLHTTWAPFKYWLFAYFQTAYPREIRHPRLSQRAANRWLLAVTLLRNPSLLQYRRQWYSSPLAMSEADTASITVLVQ